MSFSVGSNESQYVGISQLNPYSKWTIKARCTFKAPIKTYSNSKGEGKLFTFDLIDSSGEIRCTCFNEVVDIFEPLIQVDNVYIVSQGTIKPGNPRYTKSSYEMTLNKASVVKQDTGTQTSLPRMRYSFVDIGQIQDRETDQLIDVIGVITRVGDITTITTKKDQRELRKRSVDITDQSKRTVEVTFWGEQAEDFNGDVGVVLVTKNVRINDFQGGKSLNMGINSQVELNPNIPKARELLKWYNDNASTIHSEVYNISNSNRGSGNVPSGIGSLQELKNGYNPNDEKGFYLRVPCTILWIKHDENAPLYYKAVPLADGRQKVVENTINPGNGKPWFCPALNQYYDTYIPRFILTLVGADFTGSQFLNCFDDCGRFFLGCEAKDVEMMKGDAPKLEAIFQQALYQRHLIKLRAKEDTYGDETRLRCVVVNVEPIDFVRESLWLIEKIRGYHNQ